MDTKQLEILTENYLNKEARKNFLELISNKFSEFKENNDTHLTAHSGYCAASVCKNYGSKGYSFKGNKSNTLADLLFDSTNKEDKYICECHGFINDDPFLNSIRKTAIKKQMDDLGLTDEDLIDLPF